MKRIIYAIFLAVLNIYASDIQNMQLKAMQLDESACEKGIYNKCAEYLILKNNQDNNLYSTLPFQEYTTAKTEAYLSPEQILKDVVPDLKDATEKQIESLKGLGLLVMSSSKESLVFTETELYAKQIQKKYSRINELDFLKLLVASTKVKTKIAILQLNLYQNNSLVDKKNEK